MRCYEYHIVICTIFNINTIKKVKNCYNNQRVQDVDGKRREEEIAALSRADFVAENEAHTRPERPKMPEPRQRNEGGPTTRSSAHLHLNPRTKAARRSSLNGEGRETPLKSSKGDLLPAVLFGPALSDFREQLTASLDAVTLFRYAHVCRDWLEEARYDLDEKVRSAAGNALNTGERIQTTMHLTWPTIAL